MKTSVYVDSRRKSANGEYPVFIRVYDESAQKAVKFGTGLTSPVPFKGREFPKGVDESDLKTFRLNSQFSKIQKVILLNEEELSLDELKPMIDEAIGKSVRRKKLLFVEQMAKFAQAKSSPGTAKLYRCTINKINSFDAKATFDTINEGWLMRFEKFCGQTMSINGMAIVFRNIRTVFNWARRNNLTDKYPFLNYSIKHEETRKRNVDVAKIRKLRDITCMTERITEYRDMWMLMLYLIGINGKDLFTAKNSQLVDGRLEYRRAKTGKLYSIKVEPEAMSIINRYRGKEYLLNVMERFNTYDEYMRRMDHALHDIGRKYTYANMGYDKKSMPLIPGLTTYYSRHSWASLAAEIDVTFEVISAALGHSIANPTTAIYINFNQRKVDEANRRVIDFINRV